MGNRSTIVARNSFPGPGNDVSVSEKEASLELSSGLPLLISESRRLIPWLILLLLVTGNPCRKKHTGNRQPKSGPGFLALVKAGATSTRKMVEAVRDESVDNGLMVSDSLGCGFF
ncbi:hypothetical protein OIU76_023295 [Salix suchowensis]|nr:hypothetical protein OIU76_023295 [Salix suchowensis]